MMKKAKWLVLLAGISAAPFAVAGEEEKSGVSANVGVVNNYLYRGISQTGGKPAVQGGFDYEGASGLYLGVWGSNSSFFANIFQESKGVQGATNSSVEIDTYLGFKSRFAADFDYDVGFLRYNFPGDYPTGAVKGDTNEIYGAVGYKKLITAKYSYSLGDTFGIDKARGTNYIEVNGDVPVAEGVKLGLHLGRQTFKGTTAASIPTLSYTDYKVGITKELGGFDLSLAYSKTNAKTGVGSYYHILGKDLGKGATILSLSRTFK